jgi:HSP20 family protein
LKLRDWNPDRKHPTSTAAAHRSHLTQENAMNMLIPRALLLEDFFRGLPGGYFARPLRGDPLPEPARIRIDARDTDEAIVVEADLPGVRKEDIRVSLEKGVVTLGAEITQEDRQPASGRPVHSERFTGSVSRSFAVPCDIDEARSKASYANGVLTLTLAKATGPKGTRLQVE